MKVLVLPSWYPPDKGSFFREQSEAIANAGIDIDVLSLRIKGIRDVVADLSLLKKGLKKTTENNIDVYRAIYYKYPLTEKHNIRPWAKKLSYLFGKYVKKHGAPDLIHVHSSLWAGLAASIICERYKVPYVLTEHRSIFVENNPIAKSRIKPFYHTVVSEALKKARKVILVSNKLERVLTEMEPSAKEKMVKIPNFINTGTFTLPDKQIPDKPFIFSSLSHLEHVKGMDVLIRAFSILKKNRSTPVVLRIGGTGSEMTKLKSLAYELGVEKDIYFTGKLTREQVVAHMQNSHAFVLASRFEAFGVVYIEAMATGRPIIATKSGGPEEIVNKENGYLVELEDHVELAGAMEKMIESYNNFDPAKIRQQVIEKYSRESTVSKVIDVYKNTLES